MKTFWTCLMKMTMMMTTLPAAEVAWEKLPPLPDREGFASMFAGVSHGALIVAGGANFPDKRPWEGGTKVWYDDIWALPAPQGEWHKVGHLPRGLGYGASVTWQNEIICAGGSHATGHVADVFALRLDNGKITARPLPPLPTPCANMSWEVVEGVLYMAGGIEKPDATVALATFWALDLRVLHATWKILPPCPGPARMLAVAGGFDGAFHLFGGAGLQAGVDGKPSRIWLKDAWRYTPTQGWESLADLPRVVVAAPSPAMATEEGLLIVSGDDGSKAGFKPETGHPGFPKDSLLYTPDDRAWRQAGPVPFSLATAPVTRWQGGFVIPCGEARPGYRTPAVWFMKPASR